MNVYCGVLYISLGVVNLIVAVASFFSPKLFLKNWVVEAIKVRMRNPHNYLTIRRSAHLLGGAGFIFIGSGDCIKVSYVSLALKAFGCFLLTGSAVIAAYGNRAYVGRWGAPR